MKYLLIDTNCWVNLLEADPDQKLLGNLAQWIHSGEITLFVPKTLLSEWNDKKYKKIAKIKSDNQRMISAVASQDSPMHTMLEIAHKELQKTAKKIDQLLANGHTVPLTDGVKVSVSDRQLKRLVPFEDNNNALSDALIFYSTLEEVRRLNLKEFIFASNDSDFRPTKESRELHPDLIPGDIFIEFHTNLGSCLGKRIKRNDNQNSKSAINSAEYSSIYYLETNSSTLSPIQQLYGVYQYVVNQQPFVPTKSYVGLSLSKENTSRNPILMLIALASVSIMRIC